MAMSYYPNWEEKLQEGNYLNSESEMNFFNPNLLTDLSPEVQLVGFDSINGIYDPFNIELFPDVHDEYDPYPYLKEYQTGIFSTGITPNLHGSINGFAEFQSPSIFQERYAEFVISNPPLLLPHIECRKKSLPGSGSSSGRRSLSAQSMAARERRRKITEKTKQLWMLIPESSSQKMNTAEMFQAAFKYIKFLQAQVGILESMSSSVNQDSFSNEELERLLESSLIQEKLYVAEKCLVPKKLFQSLADHQEL